MPAAIGVPRFEIDDAKPFNANLEAFFESLVSDDPRLVEILKRELPKLLLGEIDRPAFWDALYAATAEGPS